MTTEELELSILAAKTLGIELQHIEGTGWVYWPEGGGDFHFWYPADDDGDSRRLEVECNMCVTQFHKDGDVWASARRDGTTVPGPVHHIERYADHGGDKAKATRWAVLRAAAARGSALGG